MSQLESGQQLILKASITSHKSLSVAALLDATGYSCLSSSFGKGIAEQVPANDYTKVLLEFKDKLKGFRHPSSGEQMLDGTHIQAKLRVKIANLMFKEFLSVFVKSSG